MSDEAQRYYERRKYKEQRPWAELRPNEQALWQEVVDQVCDVVGLARLRAENERLRHNKYCSAAGWPCPIGCEKWDSVTAMASGSLDVAAELARLRHSDAQKDTILRKVMAVAEVQGDQRRAALFINGWAVALDAGELDYLTGLAEEND